MCSHSIGYELPSRKDKLYSKKQRFRIHHYKTIPWWGNRPPGPDCWGGCRISRSWPEGRWPYFSSLYLRFNGKSEGRYLNPLRNIQSDCHPYQEQLQEIAVNRFDIIWHFRRGHSAFHDKWHWAGLCKRWWNQRYCSFGPSAWRDKTGICKSGSFKAAFISAGSRVQIGNKTL